MSREQTKWITLIEHAEEIEDAFAAAAADRILTEREVVGLRMALRQNTQAHVQNQHEIALSVAFLNGGEPARGNYHSQVRKRERLNQSAGYRTLGEGRAATNETA